MIFNTTYNNREYDTESALLVGEKFSFLKRIKLGGIGSGRLMIKTISLKLNTAKQQFSEIQYGNIELRPKGIIVHFTQKLARCSWVIPYYRLVIYNAQFFSIHANGNCIQFTKNKNYLNNKKFINKMIDLKNDALNLSYYDY
ncbi:hypothetical protein [Polaribacter butkevichii]|uniref:Uncharacterized protein n=1 Tax=Polaribacter butkevichii TaxID=218490 RepID=A0A2P6CDD9_9FLAO|nr:hypothetical protein [Polaribacter butkevichii]PQJ72920.1 hypothetical protein BTO14_06475 [Polaribacter butkevichii]